MTFSGYSAFVNFYSIVKESYEERSIYAPGRLYLSYTMQSCQLLQYRFYKFNWKKQLE